MNPTRVIPNARATSHARLDGAEIAATTGRPAADLAVHDESIVEDGGDPPDLDRLDRGLPAYSAARRRVEVPPEALLIDPHTRPQEHVDDIVSLLAVERAVGAVINAIDLLGGLHDAFGEEEAGGQLEVVSGRPHRDGDLQGRLVAAKAQSDFERLLDRERVLADPHHPFPHLPDTAPRRARAEGLRRPVVARPLWPVEPDAHGVPQEERSTFTAGCLGPW